MSKIEAKDLKDYEDRNNFRNFKNMKAKFETKIASDMKHNGEIVDVLGILTGTDRFNYRYIVRFNDGTIDDNIYTNEVDFDFGKKEYMQMKDIKGNEDLHEIAKRIKFENASCYVPKNITRKQFLQDIKSEIEWYMEFVDSPVSKTILEQEYLKILKIEEMEMKETKNMKEYEKVIDKRNTIQNAFAINYLLQNGRNNLLDDKYFSEILEKVDNNKNSFATPQYQKEAMKIARRMAGLTDKQFCEYIYDKVKEEKKLQRNR